MVRVRGPSHPAAVLGGAIAHTERNHMSWVVQRESKADNLCLTYLPLDVAEHPDHAMRSQKLAGNLHGFGHVSFLNFARTLDALGQALGDRWTLSPHA